MALPQIVQEITKYKCDKEAAGPLLICICLILMSRFTLVHKHPQTRSVAESATAYWQIIANIFWWHLSLCCNCCLLKPFDYKLKIFHWFAILPDVQLHQRCLTTALESYQKTEYIQHFKTYFIYPFNIYNCDLVCVEREKKPGMAASNKRMHLMFSLTKGPLQ